MQRLQPILGLPRHKCRHCCQHVRLSILTRMVAPCAEGTRDGGEAAAPRGPNPNGSGPLTSMKHTRILITMRKGPGSYVVYGIVGPVRSPLAAAGTPRSMG